MSRSSGMDGEPLKIGLVLDDGLDRDDGVQQYVKTLGRWLIEQGHQVRFLVGETEDAGELAPHTFSLAKNVHVRANANRMTIPLPANRRRIRQVLADGQFDVLHIQMPYSPFLAGRVVSAAAPETAVVGSFHIIADGWLEQMGSKLLALYERRTLRRFDRILSASDSASIFAHRYFGISSRVVPNMVDTARFAPSSTSPAEQLIVFLGRLVPRKGCQHFIGALTLLQQRNALAGWRAVVASDGPLRAQLEAQVQATGLSETVSFTGFVSEAEKARLLGRAALAVFPSTGNESFGIVLIEAMAARNPVVVGGNNAGYRYVLGPRADQLLIDPTDHEAFADRLQRLMNAPAERADLRRWQQSRVRDFAVGTVGAEIVGVYREALEARVAKLSTSGHTKR